MPPKLRTVLRRLAYSPLPPTLLVGSLILADYQVNIEDTYVTALAAPAVLAVVLGTLTYLLYRWILRSRVAALAAALLAAGLLYDFEGRLQLIGWLGGIPWVVALYLLLILAVCGAFGWVLTWASARYPKFSAVKFIQFAVIAVSVTFTYSAATIGYKLVRLYPQTKAVPSAIAAQNHPQAASKPDIYYLVLEDYANQATLKSIYNLDNSPFLDYLTSQGFTVKNDAQANYPYTQNSIPSTLEMNYLTAEAAKFKNAPPSYLPMRAIFDNPPIVQALKKQGYQYLQVGSWWTDTRDIPSADQNYNELFQLNLLGAHFNVSEFDYGVLNKSVFGHMLRTGLTIGGFQLYGLPDSSVRNITQYQMNSLKSIATAKATGGRFIFGHILMPHPPFVYAADGSVPTYNQDLNDDGATIEQKYVNQLQYINSQTQSLIDTIKKSSGTPPVIIIQSDEGPHPRELGVSEPDNFDLTKLSDAKLQQKYGILAAYDLPGTTPSEQAQLGSPVNTFRVLLNHYFGYSLDMLPACSYAMEQVKPFAFTDVTSRLGAPEDPRCTQIHK